jgi:hypothetical protein
MVHRVGKSDRWCCRGLRRIDKSHFGKNRLFDGVQSCSGWLLRRKGLLTGHHCAQTGSPGEYVLYGRSCGTASGKLVSLPAEPDRR